MKRIVAVLISILLVITTMPIYAFAETTIGSYGVLSYEIIDGEVTITDCDSNAEGEIVIPSIIDSCPVVSIGNSAFSECYNITDVVIPNTVHTIGRNCFYYCISLTHLTVPDKVTVIDWSTFAYCRNLISIELNSKIEKINQYAFKGCTNLINLTLPESVTSLGYESFSGCESITDIAIPNSVTNIDALAFQKCTNLINVSISKSVESIGEYAFAYCYKLDQITVDEKNDYYCSVDGVLFDKPVKNLIQYPIGRKNTSYMIPNSVENIIEKAFCYCKNLTNIVMPDSVLNIGKEAFYQCDGISDVWYWGSLEQYNQISIYRYTNESINSNVWHYNYCSVNKKHAYDDVCDENCNVCNYKRIDIHVYDNACDSSCNNCSYVREAPDHIFDNDCDEICNNCDFIREVPEHSYGIDYTCDICKYSKAPDVPNVDTVSAKSVTLQSVAGLEYSIDMVNWQSSPVFSDLAPNTIYTFYQRVAESENSYASEASIGLQVTTKKAYIIKYDANGGINAPDSQTKIEGVALVLTSQEPVRSGYIFTGWSDTADGNVTYSGGDEYVADSDIVLYAKWIKICTNCEGTGEYGKTEICETCVGEGIVYTTCTNCDSYGNIKKQKQCTICSGSGFTDNITVCYCCKGTGRETYYEDCRTCGGDKNIENNCSACGADGTKYNIYTCEICSGTGIEKVLKTIKITQLPETLTFLEGKDELSVIGGKITLYYDDNTSQMMDIIPSMITGFDNTVVGSQTLTVTYNGKTDTYNIEIIAKTLESIEVTTSPSKTHYLVGKDSFSVEGGKVTLYYNNDTSDIIDLNSSMVSGFSNQVVGVKTLTVTYKGKTDTFNITVDEKTLTSISVTAKPNKLSYLEGESFSKTGMVVTAYYNNDTNEAITDYSISGYSSTPGTKTITVTYNGKTDTFTVTVLAKSLSSIAVTTKPSKLTYTEGEAFDKSGVVVTAYYNNNTSGVVTDYTVSGYTSTPGTKTITVTYGGKIATFTVTVKSGVPQSVTSSKFTVSGNKISKISAGTTVSALLNGISEGAYCKVYNGNSVVSSSSNVGTGMVVKIMDGNTVKASYTVIVTGDTNGDGNITVTDMIAIKAHVLKKSTLSGVYATAADTNGDSGISITDFIQVKAKILGKGSITAR